MKSALQRRRLILSVAAFGATAVLPACDGGGGGGIVPSTSNNVVQSAQSKPELSTFVEAVNAADLNATLQASGPYTVFAPTNDAFTALLGELGLTKDALLTNKSLLNTVLKYHVLSEAVRKADISLGKAIVPLSGGFFKIEAEGSALKLTDGRNRVTNVTSIDGAALNGVIHIVDRVLLPANQDIVQTAQSIPSFSILVEAVVAAGLDGTLKGAGPYTVFAPTNNAFVALLAELGLTKDALLADTALLTKVLTYHVLPARVLKAEIPLSTPIPTVQGQTIVINSSLQIIDQRGRSCGIAAIDIFNSNGVVHVIDKVLLMS